MKIHQRHRRRSSLDTFLEGFTVWLIVSGGASGILIGAIILNWIEPGHPIYLAIQEWLRGIFG